MSESKAGESDLRTLLDALSPRLISGEFVFCTMQDAANVDCTELTMLATFREEEGLTIVIPRDEADTGGLVYTSVFSCITLTVHSSLDAVGLTAAVSSALSDAGISANIIAAYYHDHVFVPAGRAEEAVTILNSL